jgi:hypothetical protein
MRAVLVFVLLALAPAAHARVRIPIPVHTGQEMFEVGPLPAELQAWRPELKDWKVAWMCDRIGILFADVWTWNCRIVAYDGKSTYDDVPQDWRESLEAEHPMSKARGLWNRYGVLLIAVALAVLGASRGALG